MNTAIVALALAAEWNSPVERPDGLVEYKGTKYTQEIAVTNDRDRISRVPIARLKDKWHQSGGMLGVTGWTSVKYKLIPNEPKTWIGNIGVKNSFGSIQYNRGLKVVYPDGTRFDDILSNKATGNVFEHRMREKVNGKWSSKVLYENERERPASYTGLTQTCASCHSKAGTGGYATGLVPGGDTVLSVPLNWSLVGK